MLLNKYKIKSPIIYGYYMTDGKKLIYKFKHESGG